MPQSEEKYKPTTELPKPPAFAGLGFPWLQLLYLGFGITEHKDTVCKPEPAVPYHKNIMGHTGACSSALRSFYMSYLIVYWLHGGEDGYGYPAYGRAAEYNLEWIVPIVIRNLVALYVICGVWDYILFYSRLAPYFAPYKMFPEYPTFE